MMSLAKQQSQQSQNRQAGSQGPGLSYGLQILFSHGVFFPLIEMLHECKIILESNSQRNIKVKHMTFEKFFGC